MPFEKIKVRQRNEAALYLCDLISGVPFHSQQDLGEDLWHVEAVLPATVQEDNKLVRTADTSLRPFNRAVWWKTSAPVPPEEVFFLLSDFRQRVAVTHLPQLVVVVVSQRVVACQSVALRYHNMN